MSESGADQAKQGKAVQLSLLCIGTFAITSSVFLSLTAQPLVLTLMGASWVEAISVLQVFALSVGPRYITHVLGISMDAMGELNIKLRIQSVSLLVMIAAVLVTASSGLVAIAWAVVCVEVARMLVMMHFLRKRLSGFDFQVRYLITSMLVISAVAAISVFGVLIFRSDLAPQWILLLCLASALFSTVVSFLIVRNWIARLNGVKWLMQRMPLLSMLFQPLRLKPVK